VEPPDQVRRLVRLTTLQSYKCSGDYTEDEGTNCPAHTWPRNAMTANHSMFLYLRVAPTFREECSASDKMSATTSSRKFNSLRAHTGQNVLRPHNSF